MTYKYLLVTLVIILFIFDSSQAQNVTISRTSMIALTSGWDGERYESGRPKVPQDLLDRVKNISIEEAWGVMRGKGYHNQFEGNWEVIHEGESMVGRALTAQYMPLRPDLDEKIKAKGDTEGRIGSPNSWPIDALKQGDIYVADGFGKVIDGTLIGDNLGTSIYANSGNGVVFNGSLRDLEGLSQINGFNAYVKGWDPSFIQGMMLSSLNTPIRIGRATVLPGDVVLAKREGVIFIPAHLVEEVVTTSEFIALRDKFGKQRLNDGVYTPGQIDRKWTDDIKEDFLSWLDDNPDLLPMSRAELDEYLENRTW